MIETQRKHEPHNTFRGPKESRACQVVYISGSRPFFLAFVQEKPGTPNPILSLTNMINQKIVFKCKYNLSNLNHQHREKGVPRDPRLGTTGLHSLYQKIFTPKSQCVKNYYLVLFQLHVFFRHNYGHRRNMRS